MSSEPGVSTSAGVQTVSGGGPVFARTRTSQRHRFLVFVFLGAVLGIFIALAIGRAAQAMGWRRVSERSLVQVQAALQRAEGLADGGQLDEATRLLEELARSETASPLHAVVLAELAELHHRRGEPDRRLATLQQLVQLHPDCALAPGTAVRVAQLLAAHGRPAEAVQYLEQVMESGVIDGSLATWARLLQAEHLVSMNRPDDAEHILLRLLNARADVDPLTRVPPSAGRACLLLAIIELGRDDTEGARYWINLAGPQLTDRTGKLRLQRLEQQIKQH